jgi:tetratricopeptide (TPR) repeat protein
MRGMSVTKEHELITKSYYQSMIDENNNEHPIQTLGNMYIEEMKKEQPDVSMIRFAQGEVYFLHHDYEAAIYKWQHPLHDDLIPWGQKNIADAHMEMGLFDYAEKFYKEVETDSEILKSEVLLQLFSLYIQQDQVEKAVETIKKAVRLNPDYADVTEIAKRYFDEIQDWDSAIELAVQEGIRTESTFWFDALEEYGDRGYTVNYAPAYFKEVLTILLNLNKHQFERVTAVLWKSYQGSDFYFDWLEEVNELLSTQSVEQAHTWTELPSLFKEGYIYLTSGRFLLEDITELMQQHVTNWFVLSSSNDNLYSSTAILAWNERFPSNLSDPLLEEAEDEFEKSTPTEIGRQEGIALLRSVKKWAEKEGLAEQLALYMGPKLDEKAIEEASPMRIRDITKDTLIYLSDQKAALEKVVIQEIDWKEELLTELNHFYEHLREMETEKAEKMVRTFHDFKQRILEKVQIKLPEMLRNSTDLVKEDSDPSKLHIVLNEEMNKRIRTYMEKEALPEFRAAFQRWLSECEAEFQESQDLLDDLSGKINLQFNEEKVAIVGDFKVLDDWQRDFDRITRGLGRGEEINIWLRNQPSQLLLKGAGKLLGTFTKNKEMLLSRYKDAIASADYQDVVVKTTDVFTQQIKLFEGSIEWDVNRFFNEPQEIIRNLTDEVQTAIENKNESLEKLRENPALYQDPLTLFELKLRHYELMNKIN